MSKVKDLTDQVFGRLTVIKRIESQGRSAKWLCQCDCGEVIEVLSPYLINNKTKSCGCLRNEISRKKLKHIRENGQVLKHDIFQNTRISLLNSKTRTNNTSGHIGVCWCRANSKWKSQIQLKGTSIHLGYFDKLEDAVAARAAAEDKYFKPIIEEFKQMVEV
ncbi:HNH endonuclease [Clostridium botulinum]|uniref:HNH endonuclease n=1 Tax=Clostridium botulinum TaxID=1491 RepID=A0A6M0SSB3_CLOBO|nr:HNH endonuclease [Clostridium botulinum]